MLPNALAIGVPYETFWHLTPKKLKSFYKAYELKRKLQDEQMWFMGQYVLSAVSMAVEHNLHGRKARSKYIEKPILQTERSPGNGNPESNEQVAVFEMKQRINMLKGGLPESPS